MAEAEETSAQRQARIRREKREAKIKGTAQERLEKITKLSGRTPEMSTGASKPIAFDETDQRVVNNTSPAPTPPRTASPAIAPRTQIPLGPGNAEQTQAQEEYLRTLLGNAAPQEATQGSDVDDPMVKMLNSMLGGMGGAPNAEGMPSLNPDDIAKATGLPPFLMNMVMGKQETPVTPAQQKETRIWTLLHLLFAFIAGIYLMFTVSRLTDAFGTKPPAPATVQNPFVVFVMGEMLLHGSRTVLATPRKRGFGFWIQTFRDLARDGSVVVFMLGMYNWWQGLL